LRRGLWCSQPLTAALHPRSRVFPDQEDACQSFVFNCLVRCSCLVITLPLVHRTHHLVYVRILLENRLILPDKLDSCYPPKAWSEFTKTPASYPDNIGTLLLCLQGTPNQNHLLRYAKLHQDVVQMMFMLPISRQWCHMLDGERR
jgi:hypothetical protein